MRQFCFPESLKWAVFWHRLIFHIHLPDGGFYRKEWSWIILQSPSMEISISHVFREKYFPLDLEQDSINTSCFPILCISVGVETLLLPNIIHPISLFNYLTEATQ